MLVGEPYKEAVMGGHWKYNKIKFGDHLTISTHFVGLLEAISVPPSMNYMSLVFKWELKFNNLFHELKELIDDYSEVVILSTS